MPSHFDRFRLLNDGRIRNESPKYMHLRGEEWEEPIVVLPDGEAELPKSSQGETIIDVVIEY